MSRLLVSPEAEHDLLDIWLYIADDSPTNADRFLDQLAATANQLAGFGNMGRDRPELAKGIESSPFEHYVLFYRPSNDGIELVRVLRSSRDVSPFF